jgi:hypothetical protein
MPFSKSKPSSSKILGRLQVGKSAFLPSQKRPNPPAPGGSQTPGEVEQVHGRLDLNSQLGKLPKPRRGPEVDLQQDVNHFIHDNQKQLSGLQGSLSPHLPRPLFAIAKSSKTNRSYTARSEASAILKSRLTVIVDCCNATDPEAFDRKCIELAEKFNDSAKYDGDFKKWTPLLAMWYKKAGRVAEAKNAEKVLVVKASIMASKPKATDPPKGKALASLPKRLRPVGGSVASTPGSPYTGIRGMPER